jgi:hypothetical protein
MRGEGGENPLCLQLSLINIGGNMGVCKQKIYVSKFDCSVSRWRPQKVDKPMVLEYTHGLFIT